MYFLFIANYNSNKGNLEDKVDIYINSMDNLSDVLYQNGVIQDKSSFDSFLKSVNADKKHLKIGKKVTFKKAMTYEEIFETIYQSK
ncbi:hypothetical protein Csac_1289 [Caldicellulosiruptor saccharolyticus DSM 8903]|uniref:Uncharacterized protein n=1 Tax=Caldicellulosiruptor saccharolyticus (strain ATCC 43494 / DSM 8903 / Tp8T 6331) TaxID=351627 RepID=A4XJ06_CALS8|nr:hypothetical protein [Caldicellulosiruptor saccharolyticus]ABP66891.1 hypothetical protein Csac_1289 [Caldicellulosiruptor saccharolyticus DSM 8903]